MSSHRHPEHPAAGRDRQGRYHVAGRKPGGVRAFDVRDAADAVPKVEALHRQGMHVSIIDNRTGELVDEAVIRDRAARRP